MSIRIRTFAFVVTALWAVTACGGKDTPTGTVTPVEKTCTEDPTQTKCIVVTPVTTYLRTLAAAKGRSFGTAVDATFFGATPAAYDTVVAHEFNLIVAGNV